MKQHGHYNIIDITRAAAADNWFPLGKPSGHSRKIIILLLCRITYFDFYIPRELRIGITCACIRAAIIYTRFIFFIFVCRIIMV